MWMEIPFVTKTQDLHEYLFEVVGALDQDAQRGQVVDSLSLGRIQTCLDIVILGNLQWVTLL